MARMTGGELHNPAMVGRMFGGVSIDSRTIRPGELFVAIRGDNHDGHQFISAAIAGGAAGILSETNLIEIDRIPVDLPVVAVKNSHEGMMLLAENYRLTLDTKVIGISGSNGKTTTKEWTYRLIKEVEPRSYRSAGNWNNLFGMPLAIFAIPADTRLAVMEMGISKPNEMTRLTRIVKPDVIMITNIGPSHLEYLDSVTGVARAKLEMVTASEDSVPVIVNADDEILYAEAKKVRGDLITFGIDKPATFTVEKIDQQPGRMTITIKGKKFILGYTGLYHVYNLLAAWSACRTAGINFDDINTESIRFTTDAMRGESVELKGIRFTVDCYNANPESMRSALNAFADEKTSGRKVAILGDMLELGDDAPVYHRAVGRQVTESGIDRLITVGELSKQIAVGAIKTGLAPEKIIQFENTSEVTAEISSILREGDLVLLKASRGVGLEGLLQSLKNNGGND